MSDQYNGWANYETWAVGMYLDGNHDGEGTYKRVLEVVREVACEGKYQVAQALEEFFTENLPELDSIAGDLLGAAVSEIDWDELAAHKYDEIVETWMGEARDEGARNAKSAATWMVDGNTKQEAVQHVLKLAEDGDPSLDDYLPRRPDLSGEWADAHTPQTLGQEITGCDEIRDEIVDALATAYEQGVSHTFEDACVSELRKALSV